MIDTKTMKNHAASLGLTNTKNSLEKLLRDAETSNPTYTEFLAHVLNAEIKYRLDKASEKRIKEAGFPSKKTLESFDLSFQRAISERQFKQLSELRWIEDMYNLILLGPPGTGKTHLSIALGYQAAMQGYKVSFVTMTGLIQVLRTAEISRKSKAKLNRIYKSSLVIIDEVGYLPIEATDGNLFFQLISDLHEQASIVITSNKGFEQWTEFLGDAALATAILDRLCYQYDLLMLDGKSYRLEHRKNFLQEQEA